MSVQKFLPVNQEDFEKFTEFKKKKMAELYTSWNIVDPLT